jgi:hypothetical protein
VGWRNKLKRARVEEGARTAKGIDGEPLHGPRLNESDLVTGGATKGYVVLICRRGASSDEQTRGGRQSVGLPSPCLHASEAVRGNELEHALRALSATRSRRIDDAQKLAA